jgi:hypothetical protein
MMLMITAFTAAVATTMALFLNDRFHLGGYIEDKELEAALPTIDFSGERQLELSAR